MTVDLPAARPELDAARLLLSRMGIDPQDLITTPGEPPPMPTFEVYIPVVAESLSENTARAYGSYWKHVLARWGQRRLDEITASDTRTLAEYVKTHARVRRNSRGGRTAAEHLIAAIRCIYRHAEDDELIDERANPARKVTKPRRLPSNRRALPDNRLDDVNRVSATTGNDPELDSLLVRLHTETACRRGGALSLCLKDLDRHQCLIHIREKGGTDRWQPVSPTLMAYLLAHAEHRGATRPGDRVLRYANGRPLTRRRYDSMWDRIRLHLPWADSHLVSTHWLRHTTLTWVERNFGFAIAHKYAGHTGEPDTATATYVKATLEDIATALAALTGEPHPLANGTVIER